MSNAKRYSLCSNESMSSLQATSIEPIEQPVSKTLEFGLEKLFVVSQMHTDAHVRVKGRKPPNQMPESQALFIAVGFGQLFTHI